MLKTTTGILIHAITRFAEAMSFLMVSAKVIML
jgi:hypothetical protein